MKKDPFADLRNHIQELTDTAARRERQLMDGNASLLATCKAALNVRMGDLRYHQVNVIPQPQTPSPWGIYTDAEDPLTAAQTELRDGIDKVKKRAAAREAEIAERLAAILGNVNLACFGVDDLLERLERTARCQSESAGGRRR